MIRLVGRLATAIELDVDSSLAGHVTPYDSVGPEVASPSVGSYIAPVDIRAAVALPNYAYAFRAGSRTCYLRRLFLMASCNPTAAVASSIELMLVRHSSQSALSGGSAQVAIKKRTNSLGTSAADVRSAVGSQVLITAAVEPMGPKILSHPRSLGGTTVVDHCYNELNNERFAGFEMSPGEGFLIVPTTAMVAGDFITGHIEWDER